MTASCRYRLEGLEPDNLLAFLALLGTLRAIEATDRNVGIEDRLRPRAAWDIDALPVRPLLSAVRPINRDELLETIAGGVDTLASDYFFDGQKDLNYSHRECRSILEQEARGAKRGSRDRIDLLAALMSDVAIKDVKKELIDPTPLCLLFGQGHQHFLERLATVPHESSPSPRGNRRSVTKSATECLGEALFRSWHRNDSSFSFRWDPEEDVRYALLAGDPTDPTNKGGTQHGANRLAAIGLAVLTMVPEIRAGRVRPSVVGGKSGPEGFSFAWPIWREPASLPAILAMLAHRDLRKAGGLDHLSVDQVVVARRITVGKFMNFSRALPLNEGR